MVTLENPNYITSASGKNPVNKNTSSKFEGYQKVPESIQGTVDAIGAVSSQAASTGVAASVGTISLSSLFTNSLSSLTKFVQVVEFTGTIGLFNFKFDPLLGSFLSQLSKMTEFDLIPFPINAMVSNLGNSIASQWKGQISVAGMAPDYLQQFGYTGIPMAVSDKQLKIHGKI